MIGIQNIFIIGCKNVYNKTYLGLRFEAQVINKFVNGHLFFKVALWSLP
jgi:hypothetical protein